jgi:molybdate transport system substrate-binding protein
VKRLPALLALALAVLPVRGAELTIFAAASLGDALNELAPAFQQSTGQVIRLNLGASGTLVRQIQEGAPADLAFFADEPRMDLLARARLIRNDTRRNLLANQLVVVTAADSPLVLHAPADLGQPAIQRIAIGDPATVPAGTYARAFLQRVNLWAALQARLIPCDNVRAALAAVASGNAEAGIVYRTDAGASPRVRIALQVAPPDAPAITYPAAVVRASAHPAEAQALLDYLAGPEAQAVFARHGFLPAR